MATRPRGLEEIGGDVESALGEVNVPCYVIDRNGVVSWLNPAAEAIAGPVDGRHFLDRVMPADRRRAQEVFTRNVLGHPDGKDMKVSLRTADGSVVRLDLSAAPLRRGGHVIGIFGLAARPPVPVPPRRHPHLTPRQHEVLHLLAHGASTEDISAELHISRETVRNHVRAVFRALGVHSRVEAVAMARSDGLLVD